MIKIISISRFPKTKFSQCFFRIFLKNECRLGTRIIRRGFDYLLQISLESNISLTKSNWVKKKKKKLLKLVYC